MALGNKDGRRPARRTFQPTLDGRLEARVLLSHASAIRSQTAAGGQAVVITNTSGQQFFVSVTVGTVRAFPAPGGRASLVVDGTDSNTLLEINRIIPMHKPTKGAHTFNGSLAGEGASLNIASINVTSGTINSIEGYHTAVLSGPVSVGGTLPVNRIAFQEIDRGGSIGVGGTLQTLDVAGDSTFSGSTGLFVAQDLNWFETGGNLTLDQGANIIVGRDLGAIPQPAKGSGNAGQGLYVNGNFAINGSDQVAIGRSVGLFGVLINGNATGLSRFSIGGTSLLNQTSPVNFVVRGSAFA